MPKAYTCIWSNQSAAEMGKFYKSVFKGTKVGKPVECDWLIDKFGVRWQIAPAHFDHWDTSMNKAKKEALMNELWKMKKIDLKKLKSAFDKA